MIQEITVCIFRVGDPALVVALFMLAASSPAIRLDLFPCLLSSIQSIHGR